MKAITVGSATVDIIATIESDDIERMTLHNQTTSFLLMEPGRKVDAQSVTTHVGGGAVNAAVSLKRQGYDVATLVKVGRDINAQKIHECFVENGIDRRLVREDEREATAVSLLIASHDRNAAIFTHRGANGYLTETDIPDSTLDHIDLVYVTNLSNASANLFPLIVKRAKESEAFVAVNPGIRQLTGKTRDFFDSLTNVDLFICNRDEAKALVPKLVERTGWSPGIRQDDDNGGRPLVVEGFRLSMQDYAERLHSLGPRFVGITDGSSGAYLSDRGVISHQPVFETTLVGTTGAGDAFASTLGGSLVRGLDPARSLRLAAFNAASVVGYTDAQSGLLSFDALTEGCG